MVNCQIDVNPTCFGAKFIAKLVMSMRELDGQLARKTCRFAMQFNLIQPQLLKPLCASRRKGLRSSGAQTQVPRAEWWVFRFSFKINSSKNRCSVIDKKFWQRKDKKETSFHIYERSHEENNNNRCKEAERRHQLLLLHAKNR